MPAPPRDRSTPCAACGRPVWASEGQRPAGSVPLCDYCRVATGR